MHTLAKLPAKSPSDVSDAGTSNSDDEEREKHRETEESGEEQISDVDRGDGRKMASVDVACGVTFCW